MALRSPASFGYRVPRSVGDSERDLLWTLAFRSPVRTGVLAPRPACGVNFRRQQPVVAWVSLGALLGHNASSNLDKLCLFDEVMQRCASGPARLRMPSDLSICTSSKAIINPSRSPQHWNLPKTPTGGRRSRRRRASHAAPPNQQCNRISASPSKHSNCPVSHHRK